jgi:HEAT repeat protein
MAVGLTMGWLAGCSDPADKISSSNPSDVIKALQAMALRGRDTDVDLIAETVGHKDELVAREAVQCLGTVGQPKADEALLKTASAEPRPAIREEAVLQLSKRSTPESLELLRKTLQRDPDPRVRSAAATALDRLNSRRDVKLLIDAALKEEDPATQAREVAAVEHLCGLRFGFDANASPDQKQKALDRMCAAAGVAAAKSMAPAPPAKAGKKS